ncbi:MAG: hypothetical protein NVSMB9_31910 [Isosphaeraceae bacterium]
MPRAEDFSIYGIFSPPSVGEIVLVGMFVIGGLVLMLGVLLGGMIKCAIPRQREFLADASSVRYTLQRMLLRHLDRSFFRLSPPRVRFQSLDPLFDDANALLSSLARLRAAGQCSLSAVERALLRLAQAAPGVKKRVLDACVACIATDGVVTPAEGELLRAIADSLDCPMPPLLGPRSGNVSPIHNTKSESMFSHT